MADATKDLSASTITLAQFQQALARYPALLSEVSQSKGAKPGQKTLQELDRYRFDEATARFSGDSSSQPAAAISLDEVKTLVEWKLRHGKFRPTLMNLVSQNQPSAVTASIQDGIKAYRTSKGTNSERLTAALGRISQLKGIGPATASLLLAVHFPSVVPFFSDEAFFWLCRRGSKREQIKYNVKEYLELAAAADALRDRLGVPATDVEKVAYVLVRQGLGGEGPAEADGVQSKKDGKKGERGSAVKPKPKPKPKREREPKGDAPETEADAGSLRRSKRNKS